MREYTYKGYRVKIRTTAGFHANIWPPNFGLALSEIPQATREEGEGVLMQRVEETIDRDIVETARKIAERD